MIRDTGIRLEFGKADKYTAVDYPETTAYFVALARSILLNSDYDASDISIFVAKAQQGTTFTVVRFQVIAEPQEIAGIYATLNTEFTRFGLGISPFGPLVGNYNDAFIWECDLIHLASSKMAGL